MPRISTDEAAQRLRNCGYIVGRNFYGTALDVQPKKGGDRKWTVTMSQEAGTHYGEPVGRDTVDEAEVMRIVQQSHMVNG